MIWLITFGVLMLVIGGVALDEFVRPKLTALKAKLKEKL